MEAVKQSLEFWISRNPFLSRAGFDKKWDGVKLIEDRYEGRNPFLSRAGFNS